MTANRMIAQKRTMEAALARGLSYSQAWKLAHKGPTTYERENTDRDVFDGDGRYQD